jgi:transposase
MTRQKRVLSLKGIKPIGKYRHAYKNFWVWGSFSPITGDSHYIYSNTVCKEMFVEYLKDFSLYKPDEFKIVLIDNAGFHSTKDVELPENIALLPIPPYSPELNPAERVWQFLKDKISMKFFDNLKQIEENLDHIMNELTNKQMASITGYDFLKNAFAVI